MRHVRWKPDQGVSDLQIPMSRVEFSLSKELVCNIRREAFWHVFVRKLDESHDWSEPQSRRSWSVETRIQHKRLGSILSQCQSKYWNIGDTNYADSVHGSSSV